DRRKVIAAKLAVLPGLTYPFQDFPLAFRYIRPMGAYVLGSTDPLRQTRSLVEQIHNLHVDAIDLAPSRLHFFCRPVAAFLSQIRPQPSYLQTQRMARVPRSGSQDRNTMPPGATWQVLQH